MTYEDAKAIQTALYADLARAGSVVKALQAQAPRGPMGLTAETVRLSPEYRGAKAAYALSLDKLQRFNRAFLKAYAKEERAARRA